MQALLREIDATDGQGPLSERKTLAELCDYFEEHYVKAAEYVDGRKVTGVRSLGTAKGTQANTTYRYVNPTVETAKRAAAALNMFNSERTAEPKSAEMVN